MSAMIAIGVGINMAAGVAGIRRPKSLSMGMTRGTGDGMAVDLAPTSEDFRRHAGGLGSETARPREMAKDKGGVVSNYTACLISLAFREPTRNPS